MTLDALVSWERKLTRQPSPRHGVMPVVNAKLFVDSAEMCLDGVFRHHKQVGNINEALSLL